MAEAAPAVTERALRAGDVVTYDTLDRPDMHCREGMAVAEETRDGLRFRDTYWVGRDGMLDHYLTPEELATAEWQFNVNDYRELGEYDSLDDYRPEDRAVIHSQHGLVIRKFLRPDAQRDWPTRIANAKAQADDARAGISRAIGRYKSAQAYLADLIERSTQEGNPS